MTGKEQCLILVLICNPQQNRITLTQNTAEQNLTEDKQQTEITPLLFLTSRTSHCYLKTAAWKSVLFLTENASFFEFSQSDAVKDSLKVSLDMVKLHWNCMISPQGCSEPRALRGASLLCEI